jgi:TIR domain
VGLEFRSADAIYIPINNANPNSRGQTSMTETAPPKLFISYSWSDADHEQWVVDLATQLRDSGVDVILDKWDLKEGHDAIVFMEQMVTNTEIKRVAIICDEHYATKADNRKGGVGTETQIVSKEVYDKQSQDKFVAVIAKKDHLGKPFLPTYYKSRIFIDLSEADRYASGFEQLVRWVYGKPLHVKPALGKPPSYLTQDPEVSLGTAPNYLRCLDALKHHKPYAAGSLDDYLTTFTENFERFRIQNTDGQFDEQVVTSIDTFLPARNELIQIVVHICRYAATETSTKSLHRFFEQLIPYMSRPLTSGSYRDWDQDNLKFLVHELFLYTVAILLKHECFSAASSLINQKYYDHSRTQDGKDPLVDFTVFRNYLKSLEFRNQRLNLRRLSLRADLLHNRTAGTGLEFRYLMQADFVLFMRAELESLSESGGGWFPETLLYLGHFHSAFEIFSRSESKSHFEKVKQILGISSPTDLSTVLNSYKKRERRLPSWQSESFSPDVLLGSHKLASRP